ncbi:hypothetical protein [Streptomyces prunicolor]|uniref:hypothetical protein n=1 Tax=Streptomyces prunicolor TaxID=67348 RepID=UPI00036813F7|nr:hypothetical protein [Streptomyces prunicolor]
MRRTLTITATVLLLGPLAACNSGSTKTHSAKTSSATASHSAKPTKTAAPAKAGSTGTAAKKPPTAQARKKAAAILTQEDTDFRTFLSKGQTTVGTTDFTAWYQKAVVGLDMKQTAFSKADALFTADNEPTDLLEQWRSDNGVANATITQFANDGTSPDAPNAKTRKDASDALNALAKADKDAAKIANGS